MKLIIIVIIIDASDRDRSAPGARIGARPASPSGRGGNEADAPRSGHVTSRRQC